jgi:hypothetical protein
MRALLTCDNFAAESAAWVNRSMPSRKLDRKSGIVRAKS